MKHITLPKNPSGSDFVISDINGCYSELSRLLKSVNFSESDRLFLLGNSIDRGLDSESVIELTKQHNVYPILGSSELLMLSALSHHESKSVKDSYIEQWEMSGGAWHKNLDSDSLNNLFKIVSGWPLSITINLQGKKVGLVHSEPPTDNWIDFVSSDITYEMLRHATIGQTILQGNRTGEIDNVDLVVCGHTQLARPPVTVGKCKFINYGIVLGRKTRMHSIDELLI